MVLVSGKNGAISAKNGKGRPNLAIINIPLLVLGRIWTRSAEEAVLDKSKSKSSDKRSVKEPEGPTGMVARAVLIQKISITGSTEHPIKAQPRGIPKYSNAIPPKSSSIKTMSNRASIGALLKRCFWWAFLTRGLV